MLIPLRSKLFFLIMKVAKIKCEECNETFRTKQTLYAHCRQIHKMDCLTGKKEVICEICNKEYANRKTLLQHFKNFHKINTSTKKTRIKCPHETCRDDFPSFVKMRKHLFEKHDVQVEVEELAFNQFSEFASWKTEMERQTMSTYVLEHGQRKTVDGHRQHFFCRRSGNSRRNRQSVRMAKSCKINRACPSKIEVTTTERDGVSKTFVKFWKTHYGHAQDIERFQIDQESIAVLAGNKCQCLDKRANAVMKLKRLIKLSKHFSTSMEKKVLESHKCSEMITAGSIQTLEDQKLWIVSSSQEYCVTKVDDTCGTPCLNCPVCKICIHTFICTCPDNMIRINICKHIHACARKCHESFNSSYDDNIAQSSSNNYINGEEKNSLQIVQIQASVGCKLDVNENINRKAKLISRLSTSLISDEDAVLLDSKMNEIIAILKKTKKFKFEPVENLNNQKHFDGEVHICSTKKKTENKIVIQKQSLNKIHAIEKGFKTEKHIYVHRNFDHNYFK